MNISPMNLPNSGALLTICFHGDPFFCQDPSENTAIGPNLWGSAKRFSGTQLDIGLAKMLAYNVGSVMSWIKIELVVTDGGLAITLLGRILTAVQGEVRAS